VEWRRTWGEDRVYYHDDAGNLRRIAALWTSLAPSDAFVATAAGRSSLRVEDLLQLAALVEQQVRALSPKKATPAGKKSSSK